MFFSFFINKSARQLPKIWHLTSIQCIRISVRPETQIRDQTKIQREYQPREEFAPYKDEVYYEDCGEDEGRLPGVESNIITTMLQHQQ